VLSSGKNAASYSAAADRGLRPRRFGGGATISGSGVDATTCRGLRPKPIPFAIVERLRSEPCGDVALGLSVLTEN